MLASWSKYKTLEYEMPSEGESITDFKERVSQPKFRCKVCYEKHAREVQNIQGKRHSLVRGRVIKGADTYTIDTHIVGNWHRTLCHTESKIIEKRRKQAMSTKIPYKVLPLKLKAQMMNLAKDLKKGIPILEKGSKLVIQIRSFFSLCGKRVAYFV